MDSNLLLGNSIQVILSDSRVLEGTLLCIDKDLNLVISDVIEHYDYFNTTVKEQSSTSSRHICTATVPGKHIVKIRTSK